MLAGAGVVASPLAWHRDPQLVWKFYSMRRKIAAAAQPTPAPVASTAAPIAAGWSEPVPGRVFSPLANSGFSRRTTKAGLLSFRGDFSEP
jgi:hypothetical protein